MRTITLTSEEYLELWTTVEIALEQQVMEPENRETLEKVLNKINNALKKADR